MKVLIFLCSLAVARAGIIETNYSPAASVSTVYSSINTPDDTKTYTPVVAKSVTPIALTKNYFAPAPVYESVLSTHESRINSLDGTQHTFAKSIQTPYSSVQKFDSHTNDGVPAHSTVYSSPTFHSGHVLSQPHAAYYSAPVVNTASSPITYHTQSVPVVTKSITPGLSAYSSDTPVVQAHPTVKITYSEAPSVSHMTFTGLGTSYSW